jgi:type II secretory pathway component PulJ
VTISIFSAALSAVVLCLHTAVNAWERLRESQRQSAEMEHALSSFSRDLRHLAPLLEFRLQEQASKPEAEEITFACYDGGPHALRGNWSVVSYCLEQDSQGAHSNWVRRATPCVGGRPVAALKDECVLLSGVREVQFAFFSKKGREDQWTQPQAAPAGVEVTLQFESRPAVRQRAWVAAGALEGGL